MKSPDPIKVQCTYDAIQIRSNIYIFLDALSIRRCLHKKTIGQKRLTFDVLLSANEYREFREIWNSVRMF